MTCSKVLGWLLFVWDLFHTINITLGPIPQFQYFIVDPLHDHLQPVAQFEFFLNDLSNLEQANSFSNVWILSCIFKTLLCANDMPHLVQVNGFCAPRILWWVFNALLWTNHFLHFEQTNGFSPVWVISCVFNWPLCICPIVCKGLVTFGTGKWLATLCEPFHESSFVTLFEGLASESLCMKRFGVD